MSDAGQSLNTIIEKLRKQIALDDAVPLQEDVYLGLAQRNIEVPEKMLKEKQDLFQLIMNAKHPTACAPKSKEDMELMAVLHARKGYVPPNTHEASVSRVFLA